MTINVLVNGANGKMGLEAVKAIQNDQELKLVGETGRADNLLEAIKNSHAQVVVDFSIPTAVYENTLAVIAANACPVIGTTGLKPEQIIDLQKHCAEKKLGGVIAPNFSIGAILMMRFAEQAAKYLPDVEIIELHHAGKLDAPSGTAIKTAEMIAKVRGTKANSVPIHSVRLPGLVACQEVLFGGVGETLRICHNTIHREAFMPGVILACKKVLQLNSLVYGLENLL